MRLFRVDSPLELKLQKVEALLQELGLSLNFDGYSLTITDSKSPASGFIVDSESGEKAFSLPRGFESERIGWEE
jgi:hypothetical protein